MTYNPLRSRKAVVSRRFLDQTRLVRFAIDAWAKDSGWASVKEAEWGLLYEGDASGFFGRLPFNVFRDYQLSVFLYDNEDGGADAVFEVEVFGQLPPESKRSWSERARPLQTESIRTSRVLGPAHAAPGVLPMAGARGTWGWLPCSGCCV
jgi:hypothetical protein